MLPVTIEEILRESNTKISQKTGKPYNSVSIELEKITDISHFETICDHFLTQRELQFNSKNFIDIDKVKDFIDDGAILRADSIVKENKVKDSLLDSNCYLYVETKDKLVAPIIGRFHTLNTPVKCDVKVNGEIFFDYIIQSHSKDEKHIKLNPNLILKITEKNNLKIDLKQSKDDLFIDYYKALKFLSSINIHNSFSIDDNKVTFTSIDNFNEKIQNTLEFFKDVKKIFDMFRIDYSKITFKKIDEEEKLLDFLINTLLYGALAKQKDTTGELSLKNYSFFGRRLFLLFRKIEDEKFQVFDLLNQNPLGDSNPTFLVKNNSIPASRFLLLSKESIIAIDNFFEEVYQDIISFYCNEIFTNTQLFMLACIHIYDQTKKEGFLNLAEQLNDYFIVHTPKIESEDLTVNHNINKYQVLKRRRELTSEEKRDLIELKNSSTDTNIKCCYLILLDNKDEFLLEFEKLSEEEKELFKSWPIYNLIQ